MNNVQILAVYAAIVLTPCAALMLFQAWLNRRDDRYFQRMADKARHPSMRMRSNVRVLPLTVDDFNGCDDCFVGWHGMRSVHDDMRCECCWMILPNSYRLEESC